MPKTSRLRHNDRGEVEVRCGLCRTWKAPDQFHRRNYPVPYSSYCKPCLRAYYRVSGHVKHDEPRICRIVAKVDPNGTLPCTACGKEKPVSAFGTLTRANGVKSYASQCRACRRAKAKREGWGQTRRVLTEEQRQKKRAYMRRRYRTHPDSTYRRFLERKELTPILMRRIREHFGRSGGGRRAALAALGCCQESYYRWARGDRVPNPPQFERIAEVALRIL